ncbi:MAG: hypothetical protein CMO44_16690 [Verrucomicrobiales bacterium]|nr:hypothetical protein [Verrucomicrobiales bacterium]|tara:strand:+ start:1743 stop:3545 length:1803 start_codon:yes stop_codon:yes gene_type:complete
MPYTQLNNLDFTEIKSTLKDYMRSQSDFTDYDFEGSALSQLLDVLAYNTYYTAFNANMVVNELFLDSATLRDNVVSLAKQLGYTPKSITSPSAELGFSVTFPVSGPSSIKLKAGTGFVTNYDKTLYRYVTLKDIKVPVVNNVATFSDVVLNEGSYVLSTFTYDGSLKDQKFKIQNSAADLNTLIVRVYESANSSVYEEYKKSDNILQVGGEDKVYFVNEIDDEQYELFFGDGTLGKKLSDGNVIEISYILTKGSQSNGAKSFTFSGVFLDENDVKVSSPFSVGNIVTNSNARGGSAIESIEKIKFNAPKFYGSQNRAVTSNDYSAIVRNLYPAVSDIIVFGGEDQVPPDYGKVFIAVKPTIANSLSSVTKKELTDKLRSYAVASVKPVFLDPSILFVEINSKIYFDGAKTNILPAEVAAKVSTGVNEYLKTSGTEKFNGKFRYSKFIGVIDNSDRAINSNITEITLRKDFYAQINASSFYEICYQNEFLKDCDNPVVTSTGMTVFEHPNYTSYLEDRDGKIVLYRLDSLTGDKILLNDSVGDVDYVKGEIKLYDFTILKGTFSDNRIELRVKPSSNDVEVKREVYLDVDISKSTFVAYKE